MRIERRLTQGYNSKYAGKQVGAVEGISHMADSLVDWCGPGAQQPYFLRAAERLRAVGAFQLAVDIEGVGSHGTGADHQRPPAPQAS